MHRPYDRCNTLARSTLVARGRTPARITRLLGGPDYTEPGVRGEAYFYGAGRVVAAEAHNAKLRRRLAGVHDVHRAKAETAFTASLDEGRVVSRRDGSGWVLQGGILTPGAEVEVHRRDGQSVCRRVGATFSDHARMQVARRAAHHLLDGPHHHAGRHAGDRLRGGSHCSAGSYAVRGGTAAGLPRAAACR